MIDVSLPNTLNHLCFLVFCFPEYGVVTSDGEIVYLANPIQERILPTEEILDEEKTIHSEFFDGRRGLKNEERYLKIRNYILDSWYFDVFFECYWLKMVVAKDLIVW